VRSAGFPPAEEKRMEDIRTYRIEEDDDRRAPDDEREYNLGADDEVPFHIPRD
jgi:hypothetical protein